MICLFCGQILTQWFSWWRVKSIGRPGHSTNGGLCIWQRAMRHFADELKQTGRQVDYFPLQAKGYRDSISALKQHIKTHHIKVIHVTEPSEYHTREWIESLG